MQRLDRSTWHLLLRQTAWAAEGLSISMSTSAGPPVRPEPAVVPLVWGRGLFRSCLCCFPGCSNVSTASVMEEGASRARFKSALQHSMIATVTV